MTGSESVRPRSPSCVSIDADQVQRLREAVQPIPDGVPEAWLDDACLTRFMRADGGNFDKARARLQETLEWRAKMRPETSVCSDCAKNPHAHYGVPVAYSKTGHPVIYGDFGLSPCKTLPGGAEHMVLMLESAIAMMPEGIETIYWVPDLHGFSYADVKPRVAIAMMSILAKYYPERIAAIFLVGAPGLWHTLWNLIVPFVDPVTAKKFVFVKGPTSKGGGRDFDSLSEIFDDELMAWLKTEMEQNRDKSLGKVKSHRLAYERGDGVFQDGTTHDCRGPPSFLRCPALATVSKRFATGASGTLDAPACKTPTTAHAIAGDSEPLTDDRPDALLVDSTA